MNRDKSEQICVRVTAGKLSPPGFFPMNNAGDIEQFSQPVCLSNGKLESFKKSLAPLTNEDECLSKIDLAFSRLNMVDLQHVEFSKSSSATAIFDNYFNVARASVPSFDIFLISLVTACKNMYQEALTGSTLIPVEWGLLRAAFAEIADLLDESPVNHERVKVHGLRPRYVDSNAPSQQSDPLTRWKIGHHVFFVFIQGLLIALYRFKQSAHKRKYSDAKAALSSASVITWGTSAALHYAADFKQESYNSIVRPSMEKHSKNFSFSGIMSADHEIMVQLTREIKPLIDGLPNSANRERIRFLRAYEASCDSHRFVCEIFGGSESPSLRMSPLSGKAATEVLDGIKQRRCTIWNSDSE